MAGNSSRRGAVKRSGKGNPTAGSGGRVKRGLEGKGPTPKAKDREHHVAYKRRKRAEKSAARPGRRPAGTRGAGDSEWVAGRNSVVEAPRARMPVTTVYVAEGAERDGRLRETFRVVSERGIALLEVTRNELDRLTDALDSVTDPRNLGAVVRSAAGFGAHGVVIPERRAAGMTASAWKTSAGAAARVPVAQTVNLVRQLKGYQEAGCMVVGLAADGAVSLPDLELADGPLVLVVGSEGEGMSRLVAQTCDLTVSIPMASSLESLNAGVAAGIALYEVARRRSG